MRFGFVGLQIFVSALASIFLALQPETASANVAINIANQTTMQTALNASAKRRRENEQAAYARWAAECDAWIEATPFKNLQLRISLNSLGSLRGSHSLEVKICNSRRLCGSIANIDGLSQAVEGREISNLKIASRNSCGYLSDPQAFLEIEIFSHVGYRTRFKPSPVGVNHISIADLMQSGFNIPVNPDGTASVHAKLR